MSASLEITRKVIHGFTRAFIKDPYLCYTEHGIHAYFFTMLYNALPAHLRYTGFKHQKNRHKVCVVQKEYPTYRDLGKSRRQHWDIAVIKAPIEVMPGYGPPYDRFKLDSAIEFGLNESKDHLKDDIARLSHPESGVENGFIVHLYRISRGGALVSGRDWSASSGQIITKEDVMELSSRKCLADKPMEIIYGMYDSTCKYQTGLWHITKGSLISLSEGGS